MSLFLWESVVSSRVTGSSLFSPRPQPVSLCCHGPPSQLLGGGVETSVSHAPVVKAVDSNSMSPCCVNQTGRILGLVEHSKPRQKNVAGLFLESSINVSGHCPYI